MPYFAQDQFDLAIRNYKEAIKINPEYVTALKQFGPQLRSVSSS